MAAKPDPDDESTWPGVFKPPADDIPTLTVHARRPPEELPIPPLPPGTPPPAEWQYQAQQPAPPPGDDDESTWPGVFKPPPDRGPAGPTSLLGALAQGTSATAHGLAAVPGLAYDAAALPQNAVAALTGADWLRAKPAGENVASLLDAVGLPGEPEPTLTNRVIEGLAGTIGLGAAAAGLRGALSPALRAVALDSGATANVVGKSDLEAMPVLDRFTRALTTNQPVQLAAGAGGGAGEYVADQSDSQNPTKRLALSLLGGFGGAALAGGAASGLGTLFGSQGVADKLAAKALLGNAADPAAATKRIVEYSADPANPLAGAPTTAEIAGDPGLFQTERTLRAGPAGLASPFVAKQAQRQQLRTGVMDAIEPAAGPNAADVADTVQAQAAQRQADEAAALAAAQQQLAETVRGLGPAALPEQAGPVIRERLGALRAASSENVGRLQAAVDPEGSTAIATRPIRQAINDAADREYGADPEARPGPVRQMLARLATRRTNFAELQNMRSALLRQSQGWGESADPSLGAVRSTAAEAIRQQIEAAAAAGDGFTPEQLARWRAFRAAAAEHGSRFDPKPSQKIAERTYGRPEMGPTTIAAQFFTPGERGGDMMRHFRAAFTDPATGQLDPQAATAMRQYVAGRVGALMAGDTLNRQVLAEFLKNHAAALRQLPELAGDLRTVADATELVEAAGAKRAGTPGDAADAAAALFLNRDPQEAVRGALASPNRTQLLTALRNQVRDVPQALQGLRRGVLDDFSRAMTGTSPADAAGDELAQSQAKAEAWWSRNAPVLRATGLFTADELRRLQLVRDDLLSGARVMTVGKAVGSNTAQNLSNGQALNVLLQGGPVPAALQPFAQRLATLSQGVYGVKSLLNATAQKAQQRLYEAALDPEAAKLMLQRLDPVTMDRLLGRLSGVNLAGIAGRGLPAAIGAEDRSGR